MKPPMFDHTEYQRKRRSENPERYREEARKYFRRHKDDPKWREKHRASARQWYSLHKEKRNANAHDWHQYLRAAAIEHYGKACACCGESTYEFLCIDHINGGGNRQRKQLGCSRNFYSWLRRNGYPKGFRTLCHNCNQSIGYNGYCPHQLDQRSNHEPVLPLSSYLTTGYVKQAEMSIDCVPPGSGLTPQSPVRDSTEISSSFPGCNSAGKN